MPLRLHYVGDDCMRCKAPVDERLSHIHKSKLPSESANMQDQLPGREIGTPVVPLRFAIGSETQQEMPLFQVTFPKRIVGC